MGKELQIDTAHRNKKRVRGAALAAFYRGKDMLESLGLPRKSVNEFKLLCDSLESDCHNQAENTNEKHWAFGNFNGYCLDQGQADINRFGNFMFESKDRRDYFFREVYNSFQSFINNADDEVVDQVML